MLVVVSGLPGTGKSAVAEALARSLGAVHLSVDTVEEALLGAGLPPGWTTGVAAYEATRAVAEQNLALGRVVVVDAVNDSEAARSTWRHTAATPVFVLLTLDDAAEHRRRLEGRARPFAHVREPSWDDVQARAAAYEPWLGDCLRLSAADPVDVVARSVLAQLPGRSG